MSIQDYRRWLFSLNLLVQKKGPMSSAMRIALSGIRYGPSFIVRGATSVAVGYTLESIMKPFTGIRKDDYVKKLLYYVADVLESGGKIRFSDGSEYRFLTSEKISISAKIKKDQIDLRVAPFGLIRHPMIAKIVGVKKILCSHCNQETVVLSPTCQHCGKPILTLCRKCRKITPIQERCVHCGAKL